MLKAAFILLRVLTAIGSLLALAGAIFVLLVTGAIGLLKDGFHIGITMMHLVGSGFRDAGNPPPPDPLVSIPLLALAAVFLAMFVSVFTPGQRIFLHILAAATLIATIWRIYLVATVPGTAGLYFYAFALWFLYYAVCVRRVPHS